MTNTIVVTQMQHAAHNGCNKYTVAFLFSDLLCFLWHGISCDIVCDLLTNGIVSVI